jgi:RNA polymerase sigma-70 factor (ECF subfamily)
MICAELDILIEKTAQGEMSALEGIYNEVRTSVYSYALSILKNPSDAEDVLHDCLINVWKGASGYKSQGKPLAWILTIARNLCLKRISEDQNRAVLSEEEWNDKLEGYGDLTTEEKTVLKDCLTKLSEEEQQIISLHLSGYKHREIAECFGVPLSTILSKYNRALAKLRKM